jgi:hypothetical protein
MQFSISGIFQKNEHAVFACPSLEIPRSFQQKIRSLMRNPLTFVILVWAMMFFFASLYFVYAQEVKTAGITHQPVSQKTRATIKSKAAAKKHAAPARKTETVELFSVGLETLGTDFSRQAIAGEDKPDK